MEHVHRSLITAALVLGVGEKLPLEGLLAPNIHCPPHVPPFKLIGVAAVNDLEVVDYIQVFSS